MVMLGGRDHLYAILLEEAPLSAGPLPRNDQKKNSTKMGLVLHKVDTDNSLHVIFGT
jgi:hypothetical protein